VTEGIRDDIRPEPGRLPGGPPPGGPGGPPPGGYPPPPGFNDGPSGGGNQSFFASLFDFSFSSFATPSVIKVLYILGTVLLALSWLVYVVIGFSQSAIFGIGILIFGGIFTLVGLIFLRITLEFYYAVVRMSEDIHQGRR
jgi:hypothetical protein